MMIICIESFHKPILSVVLQNVQEQLANQQVNARIAQFPSDGPFGHQVRLLDNGRIQLYHQPAHMLRMVDRMDLFLNPVNGLSKNPGAQDVILLSESQYKECLQAEDPEIQQWIIEINTILPQASKLFWLVEENEILPEQPESIPEIELFVFDAENLPALIKELTKAIAAEVSYD